MFTKAQIREIASKICWWGKKDSSLSTVSATDEDTLVVVKDGENRNVTVFDYQEFMREAPAERAKRTFIGVANYPEGVTPYIYGGTGTPSQDGEFRFSASFGFPYVLSAYAENCSRVYYTCVSCGDDNTSESSRFEIGLNLYPTVTFAIRTQLPSGQHVEGGPLDVYIDNVLVGQSDADMDSDGYEHVVVYDVEPGEHEFRVYMQEPSGTIPPDRIINGSFVANGDTMVRVSILNDDEYR